MHVIFCTNLVWYKVKTIRIYSLTAIVRKILEPPGDFPALLSPPLLFATFYFPRNNFSYMTNRSDFIFLAHWKILVQYLFFFFFLSSISWYLYNGNYTIKVLPRVRLTNDLTKSSKKLERSKLMRVQQERTSDHTSYERRRNNTINTVQNGHLYLCRPCLFGGPST